MKKALGVLGLGALALLSADCKIDAGKENQTDNTIAASTNDFAKAATRIIESNDGPSPIPKVPNFIFKKTKFAGVTMPAGLELTPSDFKTAMDQAVSQFVALLETSLDDEDEPEVRNQKFSQILLRLPDIIKSKHPELAKHLNSAEAKFGKTISSEEFINYLNRYMLSAGFLLCHMSGFDIYPVKTASQIEIDAKEFGKRTVPVIHVGKGHLQKENPEKTEDFELGHYNQGAGFVVFFEDQTKEIVENRPASYRELNAQDFIEDVLRHEAFHFPLHEKFSEISTDQKLRIPLKIDLPKMGKGNFSGVYRFIALHELAATGVQLAQTKLTGHPFLKVYIAGTVGEPYVLVETLSPFIILEYGPENEIKKRILEIMEREGSVESKIINEYLTTLSLENLREVGRQMYQIAYDLLTRAKQGEFQKAE